MMKFLAVIILLPVLSRAQNFDTVIRAFSQDDQGNCSSIAIIKASIIKYGVGNVFFETNKADGKIEIVLRNKQVITVDKKDFDAYSGKGNFEWSKPLSTGLKFKQDSELNQKILDYAKKCFAVMVINHPKSVETYDDAVRELNGGVNADSVYKYLGIDPSAILKIETGKGTKRVKEFEEEDLYLLYNSKHAAVASKNQYDRYSSLAPITRFQKNHHGILKRGKKFWAYGFK